jgi:hypothetical protein
MSTEIPLVTFQKMLKKVIHKEIKKNLSVKKDSTCSFVRDMFFCAERLCTRTNTKVSL